MTTDDVLHSGTLLAERYEVLAELGSGNFGRVYRARQLSTGQDVAIKIVRIRDRDSVVDTQRHVERFRREMRLCAALSHPHIVRLRDSGEISDGTLFAVFEFVPGVTLREIIESEGKLEPREALRLMTQVLDALSCAHAQGIVHRDLKPENIMVTKTGVRRNALVLDFGLGGFVADYELEAARLTATHEMMGTPCYAAPEQLRGDLTSPRSDLYSWGLVFLECLTGELAVGGTTAHEVLLRQLGSDPVPIPADLKRQRLGRLLEVVTAKDVEERRVTIAGLLETLTSIEREGTYGPAAGTSAAREGERRQLTLVACKTEVNRVDGEAVDLEDLDQILQAQAALYAQLAGPRDGTMVSAVADRALLVFGHPRAQENDTRRAVRSALHLVAETRAASERFSAERGLTVAVHVGAHTGLVIVRDSATSFEIIGAAPQVAARIADRAGPNEVLISDDTKRLLRGAIVCEHAGVVEQLEPGKATTLHRVTGEPTPAGFSATTRREPPLVERDDQMAQLLAAWRRTEAGGTPVVLLVGEPGIGKSRLVRELRTAVPADAWLECRCVPENRTSPLRPIVDLLNGLPDPPEALLQRHGLDRDETLPLLATLLSVPFDVRPGQAPLSPDVKKERTLAAIVSLLLRMGAERPRAFVVEDLHWADPTTVELLTLLVEELRAAPAGPRLCVVFTARPEFVMPWNPADVTTLSVPRLTRAGVTSMVRSRVDGEEPPDDVLAHIASRTDGVPLFVEELTNLLFDSGAVAGRRGVSRPGLPTAIPATLRELLTARLDALSTAARETVQLAAAIGREVRHDLLAASAGRDEALLRRDLRELIDARLLQQRRSTADESYVFRHALVRDAAYESMLRPTRQRIHRRIAATMRDRFPDVPEQQPELLAHHLEAGDETRDAITYWQRAGDRALRRAAYAEASQHLERGLAAAERLPPSLDRTRAEIELLTSLGTVQLSTQGFASPAVEATFVRARALCDEIGGDVPPKILSGIIGVTITRGDQEATDRLVPYLHRFARSSRDVVDEVTGYTGLGIVAFWKGEHAAADAYFERARPAYRSEAFQRYVREYGYDGGIFSYAYNPLNLWLLGRPVEADRACKELLAIAQDSTDPHARSLALAFVVHLAFARGDVVETTAWSERLLAIAGEQKLYFWLSLGMCGHGVGVAIGGAPDAGVGEVRQGIELTNMMGARLLYGYYQVFLVRALMAAGELDEALARTAEGLQLCREQGGRFYEPELLRLEGVLAGRRGDAAGAEAALRRALSLAQERGSPAWALRAATTLGEVLRARGAADEARAILAAALSPFAPDETEMDVRDARALLATLG